MPALMRYINVTSRCAMQYRSERLKGSDLNGVQCTYLLHLCRNPGISQDTLAEMIYINKSNVTRQLSVLEQSGYVIRKKSEFDRRVIEVYPTQKALDVLPKVREVLHDWNDYLLADMSEEEVETLFALLTRITDKAKQYASALKKD